MNLKNGAVSAQGASNARLSSRTKRKRGDQGVDGMHYTERSGTASNSLRCSWLFFSMLRCRRRPTCYLDRCVVLTPVGGNLWHPSQPLPVFPNLYTDNLYTGKEEAPDMDMSDPVPGDVFKAGDECKRSGIYRALHDPNHADEHEVTCVFGQTFPRCNLCGDYVRFVLEHAAVGIDSHEHFKT
jgi:hypothetical protein